MNAYRGKSRRGYIYVRATGKRKLRACGTSDRHTVKAMRRMVAELRSRRTWDLLGAAIACALLVGARWVR